MAESIWTPDACGISLVSSFCDDMIGDVARCLKAVEVFLLKYIVLYSQYSVMGIIAFSS